MERNLVQSVEDRRMIEELMRDQEKDDAIAASPAKLKTGKDHSQSEEAGGIVFQRCGGGRRVLRKTIGGS